MGSSRPLPLRAIPRIFLEHADTSGTSHEIPPDEFRKIHDVLRLRTEDEIVILPNNGTLLRCVLDGRRAIVKEVLKMETEPNNHVTLALAIPKPDKLEESVRLATELGVSEFWIFPSNRTIVKWDNDKIEKRIHRLRAISREAAEVSYRAKLPQILSKPNLAEVLKLRPDAAVMSESDKVLKAPERSLSPVTIVVGPEGGWDRHERELIGDRAVTLGPRVLRVDTAVAAVCTLYLLSFT